jgi:hypothetical protein
VKRIIIIGLLLFINLAAHTQVVNKNTVAGKYHYFGSSEVELLKDSTFHYFQRGHLAGSWTNGTWHIQNDTVLLKMVLVYDTIMRVDEKGINEDFLVLSEDNKVERLKPGPKDYLVSG